MGDGINPDCEIDGDTYQHFTSPNASSIACHSCHLCEGGDHHWMPAATDDDDMVMICKHCPVWRDLSDDDCDFGDS